MSKAESKPRRRIVLSIDYRQTDTDDDEKENIVTGDMQLSPYCASSKMRKRQTSNDDFILIPDTPDENKIIEISPYCSSSKMRKRQTSNDDLGFREILDTVETSVLSSKKEYGPHGTHENPFSVSSVYSVSSWDLTRRHGHAKQLEPDRNGFWSFPETVLINEDIVSGKEYRYKDKSENEVLYYEIGEKLEVTTSGPANKSKQVIVIRCLAKKKR